MKILSIRMFICASRRRLCCRKTKYHLCHFGLLLSGILILFYLIQLDLSQPKDLDTYCSDDCISESDNYEEG